MPKEAEASRRVAWFEDGELWCADDATPPVSPAGWYLRPRGTAVPWIGPFATAEEAEAAPGSGDPFAAARRRLEAWAARGGSAAAEGGGEDTAQAMTAGDGRRRRGRATAATPAGALGDPARTEERPPSPTSKATPLVTTPGAAAPRQLAFGFGPDAGGDGSDTRLARRRDNGRRGRAAPPAAQGSLPF